MRYLVCLVLAGLCLTLPVLAQTTPVQANPYTRAKVAYWDVVTQFRTAYRVSLISGIGREDLPKFALFFSDRVMSSLWDGLATRATTISYLLTLKHVGPSVVAKICLFHSFTDEDGARKALGFMD